MLDGILAVGVLSVTVGCLKIAIGITEVLGKAFGEDTVVLDGRCLVALVVTIVVGMSAKGLACLLVS
mgnify:CR=1 FL=1